MNRDEGWMMLIVLAVFAALVIKACHYERTNSCLVYSVDGQRSTTVGPDVCGRLK